MTITRGAASLSDDPRQVAPRKTTSGGFVHYRVGWHRYPGGVTMVTQLTLDEFAGRYAGNEQRKRLFESFVDELASVKSQCSSLRVLVFGSYITGKSNPHDIDLLISLIPSEDCVYALWTEGLSRRHPEEVDIHYYKTQLYMKDAEGLLEHFNNNPKNELQGIAIHEAVEIIDL